MSSLKTSTVCWLFFWYVLIFLFKLPARMCKKARWPFKNSFHYIVVIIPIVGNKAENQLLFKHIFVISSVGYLSGLLAQRDNIKFVNCFLSSRLSFNSTGGRAFLQVSKLCVTILWKIFGNVIYWRSTVAIIFPMSERDM